MKKTLETQVLCLATLSSLLGNFDSNINLIADQTQTLIYTESNVIKISGEEENKVKFPETAGSHDVYAEDGTGNTVSGSNWYSDENYLNWCN